MIPQIFLSQVISRERNRLIHIVQRKMKSLFKEADSSIPKWQEFEYYQKLYDAIRKSRKTSITVFNSAQLISALAIIPIAVEIIDFLINLLTFVGRAPGIP